MNKRQLAAMAAAAMMLICMPTTAFAALGRPGQPSASVQQQVKSERKVIKKNAKETEEETAKWQQQMLESVNKERKAAGLAELLDGDAAAIRKRMDNTKSQYEVIKLRAEEDTANAVRAYINENKIVGVHLVADAKRYYPYGSLASHVIGFVGDDNTGLYGLEARYEQELEGQSGMVVSTKDNAGNDMMYAYEQYFAAQNGSDLTLTLDTTIQYYLEKGLDTMTDKFAAANGATGIIMDAKTGGILAMASSPSYDLNDFAAVQDKTLRERMERGESTLAEMQLLQWRNKALNDTYEPGSTFKILTLAAALEEGVIERIGGKLEAVIQSDIPKDSSFSLVDSVAKRAREEGCDGVLAIGGGSVLDAAKTAAAAIANHKPAEKLVGTLKVKKQPMPLIAVPTTAGTGSETTIAAVISGTATHRKRQILDPKLVPFAAILDPELTVGLPQGNTIHTAMDALTHALEAYVSTYATPETDRYAEMAAKMIYEALPVVREEPKNVEMREQLLVASFLAGMAFTRTYVGYVHAFAHSIGGRYGVAHGLANAVLLPHIMEYYLPVSAPRLARMAQICGISGDSDEGTRARAFVESIAAMNQTGGVPERLAEFPRAEIDAVIKEAFQECHGTYPVPRYYTRPAARALLEQVCAE